MGGYSKRVIRIDFPDLTDTPEDDIWVAIRNPRLVPPHELVPDDATPITADGQAADAKAATVAMHAMFARLIVGWRAYDASTPIQLNAVGEDITPQTLLPHGSGDFNADNVSRLPMEIINAIGREVKEASNPQ